MPPKRGRGRATPHNQRGVVKLKGKSKYYRIEEPQRPQPKWMRDSSKRLVSNLPRRPNVGGLGNLEVYYHVKRASPDEVLPPPKALWRQRYGDRHTISYRPLWVDIAGNLAEPLRRRSDVSVGSAGGDWEGSVGVPYLYTYDEDMEPDEEGLQYRRWRPLKILANGGYGVVITYVDDARGFTEDADIPNEDIVVAKFNYKGGDLVDIMSSVVNQMTMSEEIRRQMQLEDEEESDAEAEPAAPPRAAAAAVRKRRAKAAMRRKRRSPLWQESPERRSKEINYYSHYQAPSEGLDLDTTDTFRQETQILEILDMTGSPHFPKFWKLADPPQDGTLCTMDYIPGGVTLGEQLDTKLNERIPIRLVWEAVFCLSKAMSAMAYGSEDPAPSHRVHGWNQIVHLDWSEANIFVQWNVPSHTCSHGPCFVVGDFGFALILPNRPKAREAFRREHLRLGWHKNLNPMLPEADIDTKKPLQERVDTPIIGHFSHKTNVFLMAEVWRDNLGGDQIGRIGVMRYMQDSLTPLEQVKLAQDLQSHLPESERLGKPLGDDDDKDEDEDEDEDDAANWAPRVRGYVDVAESLLAQQVASSRRVSEQRFVNLMLRCLNREPSERPEIEEIMLHAARGMAEAGVYVPPPPSSDDIEDSGDGEEE